MHLTTTQVFWFGCVASVCLHSRVLINFLGEKNKMVLVTGGAGYIGSHVVVELLEAGYEVIVYDNLSNSSIRSLDCIREITGMPVRFVCGDLRDDERLNALFCEFNVDAVVHLAGLKSVADSLVDPLGYFDNNVSGSVCLLKAMARHNVKTLVFSSSATVYGFQASLPLRETMVCAWPTNPYGGSKLVIERILASLSDSDDSWKIASLRFFNPVGAHKSGLIGENPRQTPTNLMPLVNEVAIGKRDNVSIFGGDYATYDGTCVRDYVHVVDLARGHLATLKKMESFEGAITINLGTGRGCSVLEIIHLFEEVNNVRIPYEIVARRDGDVEAAFADTSSAQKLLGWSANLTLEDMCLDSWNWQKKNTNVW